MKMSILILISFIVTSLLGAACSINKNISGHYGVYLQGVMSKDIYLYGDNHFELAMVSSGAGYRGYSLGQWEYIDENNIMLVSPSHNEIPIEVHETKSDSDFITVTMPQALNGWSGDVDLYVNGIKFDFCDSLVQIPIKLCPKIDSIFIVATINNNSFVNFNKIKTKVYTVKDNINNVFDIKFPQHKKLEQIFDYFYYQEVNDTLKVKNKKLIWRGNKYPIINER